MRTRHCNAERKVLICTTTYHSQPGSKNAARHGFSVALAVFFTSPSTRNDQPTKWKSTNASSMNILEQCYNPFSQIFALWACVHQNLNAVFRNGQVRDRAH